MEYCVTESYLSTSEAERRQNLNRLLGKDANAPA